MTAGSRRERRFDDRAARILATLAATGCNLSPDGGGRYELCVRNELAPRIIAEADLVDAMHRRDWLRASEDGSYFPTDAGLAWLRRHRSRDDPWRGQHLFAEAVERDAVPDLDAGSREKVTVVANESPLAWLRRRRGAGGQPLVTDIQLQAGERLRADFERGRLGPRVTADWTAPSLDRNRRGPGGGPADLLDAAIAARQRIDAAVRALGPELGSLALDVCCFLVGLEDAERKRGWPRRSAKVVLAIALDRLAAHFGLSDVARGADRSRKILHWGGDDYRPRMDADHADADAQSGRRSEDLS